MHHMGHDGQGMDTGAAADPRRLWRSSETPWHMRCSLDLLTRATITAHGTTEGI